MRKIYITFTGKIALNIEENEEISDVVAECEITHPDNTRVVDYEIKDWEIEDSK